MSARGRSVVEVIPQGMNAIMHTLLRVHDVVGGMGQRTSCWSANLAERELSVVVRCH